MSGKKYIEQDWQAIQKIWSIPTTNVQELTEWRQLFFAGATAAFLLVMRRVILNPAHNKKATRAKCILLESVKRELDEFRDSLGKDKEANDARQ